MYFWENIIVLTCRGQRYPMNYRESPTQFTKEYRCLLLSNNVHGAQTPPRYDCLPYVARTPPQVPQDHRTILTMAYNTHASSLCPFSPWITNNVGVSAARSGCDASRLLQSIAKWPPSAKAEPRCAEGGDFTHCALVVSP